MKSKVGLISDVKGGVAPTAEMGTAGSTTKRRPARHHDLRINEGALTPVQSNRYPTLSLTGDQLPPLKGADVGDVLHLEVTAQVISCSDSRDHNDRYELEIRKAKSLDDENEEES